MNLRSSRWFGVIVASLLLLSQGDSAELQIECRAAKSRFCANFAFSLVAIPNYRGGTIMSEIEAELNTFITSYTSGCSNALVHFLCAYYNPGCFNFSNEVAIRIPPCRELCHYVRSSCEPVMKQNGLTWPRHLNCSQFPSTCATTTCYPGYVTLDRYQSIPPLSVPSSFGHPVNIANGTDIGRKAVSIFFDCVSITTTEGQALQCHLVVTSTFQVDKTVQITAVGYTASSGSDFNLLTASVTIKAYTTRSDPIKVMIVNDDIVEDEEMFQLGVVLSDELLSCGVELGGSSMVNVTIEDDDKIVCRPTQQSVLVTEGDWGNFTVECVGQSELGFSLFLSTVDTSTRPQDYSVQTDQNTLKFTAGQQQATLSVHASDDDIVEGNEMLTIMITGSNLSSVVINETDLSVVIKDNDLIVCTPIPQNVCVTEGEIANVTVECDADQPLELEFILHVSVVDSTTDPTDYTLGTSTMHFSDNQRLATVSIVIPDDRQVELDEDFSLMITSDSSSVMIRNPQVPVVIKDNDVIICSKSAENVSVTEGEAVNITVNCSGYFDFDFTLFLNTTPGSAQDDVDFVSDTYLLAFSAGQQSRSLVVSTINDEDCEQEEFFKLVITGSDMPSKVQIDSDDCYVIIKDNDNYPSNRDYPECSRRYCKNNPAQSICRVPVVSDQSTSTGCTGQFDLSTCGACYYSTTVRDHPEDCRYQCPGRVDEEHLKVYGACIKEKYLEEYGRPMKNIKKNINFKCFQPIC